VLDRLLDDAAIDIMGVTGTSALGQRSTLDVQLLLPASIWDNI
jgi:hypothetical protein